MNLLEEFLNETVPVMVQHGSRTITLQAHIGKIGATGPEADEWRKLVEEQEDLQSKLEIARAVEPQNALREIGLLVSPQPMRFGEYAESVRAFVEVVKRKVEDSEGAEEIDLVENVRWAEEALGAFERELMPDEKEIKERSKKAEKVLKDAPAKVRKLEEQLFRNWARRILFLVSEWDAKAPLDEATLLRLPAKFLRAALEEIEKKVLGFSSLTSASTS